MKLNLAENRRDHMEHAYVDHQAGEFVRRGVRIKGKFREVSTQGMQTMSGMY